MEKSRSKCGGKSVPLDTTNIFFIVSGAFCGLEKITEARVVAASGAAPHLGFNGLPRVRESPEEERQRLVGEDSALYQQVSHQDLVTFGMIPEMVGRLPVLVPLHQLSERELQRVLTEPRNALCKQLRQTLWLDKAHLYFSACGLQAVARLAIQSGTGARSLRSLLERVLHRAQFQVPSLRRDLDDEAAAAESKKRSSSRGGREEEDGGEEREGAFLGVILDGKGVANREPKILTSVEEYVRLVEGYEGQGYPDKSHAQSLLKNSEQGQKQPAVETPESPQDEDDDDIGNNREKRRHRAVVGSS